MFRATLQVPCGAVTAGMEVDDRNMRHKASLVLIMCRNIQNLSGQRFRLHWHVSLCQGSTHIQMPTSTGMWHGHTDHYYVANFMIRLELSKISSAYGLTIPRPRGGC